MTSQQLDIAKAIARTRADVNFECDEDFAATCNEYIDTLAQRIGEVYFTGNRRFLLLDFLQKADGTQ